MRVRTAAKLTQAEFASRQGTIQSAVARLEGGRVSPSFGTLRRYSEADFEEFTVDLDRERMPKGFVPDPDRPTKVMVTIDDDDDIWGQDGCNIQPVRLSVKGDRTIEREGGFEDSPRRWTGSVGQVS